MIPTILYTGSSTVEFKQYQKSSRINFEHYPILRFEKLEEPKSMDLRGVQYCIVSSQKTVEFLAEKSKEYQSKDFYVVGRKTAKALAKYNIRAKKIALEGFASLEEWIPTEKMGIFLGAKELAQPAQSFLNNTVNCRHIAVYRSFLTKERPKEKEYCAVIITSPKAIKGIEALALPKDILVFAIGDSSETAALECGFLNVQKSKEATIESLFSTVTSYYSA